jgi:hypothetical protein
MLSRWRKQVRQGEIARMKNFFLSFVARYPSCETANDARA